MKASIHRQTTIDRFRIYRYMTPAELASVSLMSTATARRTLEDLYSRDFLSEDEHRFYLKHEPLFYAPLHQSPALLDDD